MEFPAPHTDTLTGAVVTIASHAVLLAGEAWQAALDSGATPIMRGELTLRYGVPLVTRGGWLVPRLIVDDHRRFHSGSALFEFLDKNGASYPRADAVGYTPDGQELDLRLKDLDISQPLVALAYSDPAQWAPTRLRTAVWVTTDSAEKWQPASDELDIPALLRQHVACYQLAPTDAARLPDLLKAI